MWCVTSRRLVFCAIKNARVLRVWISLCDFSHINYQDHAAHLMSCHHCALVTRIGRLKKKALLLINNVQKYSDGICKILN